MHLYAIYIALCYHVSLNSTTPATDELTKDSVILQQAQLSWSGKKVQNISPVLVKIKVFSV